MGAIRKREPDLVCFPCVICSTPKVMRKTEFLRKERDGYKPSTCGAKCAAEKRIRDTQSRRAA